jgi:hypothetical protein
MIENWIRLPCGENDEIGREEAPICEFDTVFNKRFDGGIILELDLAVNEHLAGAHICDRIMGQSGKQSKEKGNGLPR